MSVDRFLRRLEQQGEITENDCKRLYQLFLREERDLEEFYDICESFDVFNNIKKLSSIDEIERQEAAYLLGEAGDIIAIPALIHALNNDDDYDARYYAARALGYIGSPLVASSLLDHLHDPDEDVQCGVIEALGKIGDPDFIEFLEDVFEKSDHYLVKRAVMSAFGEIGSSKAIPFILRSLDNFSEHSEMTLVLAIESLGKIKDPVVIPHIKNILSKVSSKKIQLQSVIALGEIQDRSAIDVLVEALDSPFSDITIAAIRSLGQIGDPSVVEILSELQDDPYQFFGVKNEVYLALKAIEKKRGENVLGL